MKFKKKKVDPTKRKRLKNIEDEAAIRALVARFTDAFVVADVEEFKTLWVKEGSWTIHHPNSHSSEGVDKICEICLPYLLT